jgi:uncharacterized lipoprotein YddW (UPF0748 family)
MKFRSYLLIIVALMLLSACQTKNEEIVIKKETEPMRGVWITNIASEVLFSDQGIKDAVALCDSLGFNHIFVVTYNEALTTYPSKVMEALTGQKIDPKLEGRDPLKTLIDEAHQYNIKVHAWFEFGFSCAYQNKDGGPILKARPHWAAKDREGKLVKKNGFMWLNAFDPEVQSFVKSLVLEVVENYDIDGIQGDDRLPALPSSGGYDSLTVSMYQAENGGESPPYHEKDYNWIKWRSAKLTQFLSKLVSDIKKVDQDVMISVAPSIYPWSEQEYLQDWPTWVNLGLVDYVIPQIYRYQHARYTYELDKIMKEQLAPAHHAKVVPGILLQVDQYNPSEGMLDSMIQSNRNHGLDGEVHFFYEGIKKFKSYFYQKYNQIN